MAREMEKNLAVNTIAHSQNMLTKIIKYAHEKHMGYTKEYPY